MWLFVDEKEVNKGGTAGGVARPSSGVACESKTRFAAASVAVSV